MSIHRKAPVDRAAPASSRPVVAGLEGNYRVIRLLGRGTMASVYLAEQVSMARPVALKILSPALAEDPQFIERFMREARANARLNHANIVAAIDFGEYESRFFFAMEYIDGEPLSAKIGRDGAMDEKQVADIGLQTAAALEHAARHGVIHLDVKPANIMIRRDGRVKLGDFGLAVIMEHPGAAEISRKAVGTPYYMSPEQIEGGRLDWRADQYSLGASLYEAVTGVKPFQGGSVSDILMRRFFENPEPAFRAGRRRATRPFSAVLAKMLSRSPDSRYHSFADLAEDLARAGAGGKPAHAGLDAFNPPGTPGGAAWGEFGNTGVISRVDSVRRRARRNWLTYSVLLFLTFVFAYALLNMKALVGPAPHSHVKYDLAAEAKNPPPDIGGAARKKWLYALERLLAAEAGPTGENMERAIHGLRLITANRDFTDTAYAAAARRQIARLEDKLEKLRAGNAATGADTRARRQ